MYGLKEATRQNTSATPIIAVDGGNFAAIARKLGAHVTRWLETTGFRAAPGKFALVPDAKGAMGTELHPTGFLAIDISKWLG